MIKTDQTQFIAVKIVTMVTKDRAEGGLRGKAASSPPGAGGRDGSTEGGRLKKTEEFEPGSYLTKKIRERKRHVAPGNYIP